MRRSSLRRALRAISRARPADLWTSASTLMIAPVVELSLRLAGLQRTANLLQVRLRFETPAGRAVTTRSELPLDALEFRRLRIAWRLLGIGPFDDSCLRRALIGAWQLRKRDHAVRIGIRKTADGIKAHAWLEVDGISLDPEAPSEFAARWNAVDAAS